jgi:hypothetical protein
MDDVFDLWICGTGTPGSVVIFARTQDDMKVVERELGGALTRLTDFRNRIHDAIRGRGSGKRPSSNDLAKFGNDLFRFCIGDEVDDIYNRLPKDAHIRVNIYSNQPELQALPWEYMQVPGTPEGPSPNRSIVRIVPTVGFRPEPMDRRKSKERIRALFVSSVPKGLASFDWDAAQKAVRTAFEESLPADEFDIRVLSEATPERLRTECGRRNPHIVHFCGHGEATPDGTRLVLQDDSGNKVLLEPARFLGIIGRDSGPRLVVLAACETSAVIERPVGLEDDFTMLADTLVRGGIPAVVANQAPIHESSAQAFTRGFYEQLLRIGDVDMAVHAARCDLYYGQGSSTNAGLEWGVPTIHRHIRSARLLRNEDTDN